MESSVVVAWDTSPERREMMISGVLLLISAILPALGLAWQCGDQPYPGDCIVDTSTGSVSSVITLYLLYTTTLCIILALVILRAHRRYRTRLHHMQSYTV